jgi:hypothetical protein
MAIINCPECQKEISDKAANCPSCGFPLKQTESNDSSSNQEISCPDFPHDLSIGGQIVNWGGDAAFSGDFRPEDNVIRTINTGGVKVLLHKFGINIANGLFISEMEIHNSQIISIDFADQSELLKQNKSVIGRAVVGNLLMGPMGAIVGGMSGIGSKNVKKNSYLVINFWDRFTKQAQTILIRGKDEEIRSFVGRWNTERSKTQSVAQKKAMENLNPTDKKILELCEQKGLVEACKFYMDENKIDAKENTKAVETSMKYVQGLAKAYGIKVKSSGGCFIATACYGDYNAPEVLILRNYRDTKLYYSKSGQMFVKFYYFTSPFFARIISQSEFLKSVTRKYLVEPIVDYLSKSKD